MPFQQRFQVLHLRLHGLRLQAADVDQFVVVAIDKIALQVEHVGKAAGETGAEVHPGAPEYAHRAARHVLAAVIAGPFDHRDRAGIAYREALAGDSGGIERAAGGAVQAGIAHDDGVFGDEARARRMAQHDPPRCHALANVVVGIALEVEVQAAGVPDAKTLTGDAAAAHRDGRVLHAVVAPAARDFSGDARAD